MDKIQSKSVELFFRGFFSEGLKVDKHIDHPSLRLKKTIQKHQVNKRKNSKRWVSCKNIPFQQESFIGTSSMDSCGVFNRFRCCIQFSRHRNTRAWDSWPWEKKTSEQWRTQTSGQKQGTAMVDLCSHDCVSRISVFVNQSSDKKRLD